MTTGTSLLQPWRLTVGLLNAGQGYYQLDLPDKIAESLDATVIRDGLRVHISGIYIAPDVPSSTLRGNLWQGRTTDTPDWPNRLNSTEFDGDGKAIKAWQNLTEQGLVVEGDGTRGLYVRVLGSGTANMVVHLHGHVIGGAA